MLPDYWDRLTAPFDDGALTWRVEEVDLAGRSARVRPQLSEAAIVERLDEVLGRHGWSVRYLGIGDAVGCELTIDGIVKSALARATHPGDDTVSCGRAALSCSAWLFGLEPPLPGEVDYWVGYDPELQRIEGEPQIGGDRPPVSSDDAPREPEPAKPQGHLAIDRLVERLRAEGLGLEAARLLVQHGGYGNDPQSARELYAKLRDLLLTRNS